MSGGYFDHIQGKLQWDFCEHEESTLEYMKSLGISEKVIEDAKKLFREARMVQKRIHLLDYLIEADISEETYWERQP